MRPVHEEPLVFVTYSPQANLRFGVLIFILNSAIEDVVFTAISQGAASHSEFILYLPLSNISRWIGRASPP